ncbi:MAG: penicillin-binding protein 2 [Candidatus Sungbacteria bacterium]|uniref:Penicillin-binding protein 2 n=2 Tax=Candidatus Sungiibacteriota bacterium TaxID=2750080 RepID=A0A931YD92_9BACT|nr:penicillin-binding protein 2 [Candidatus Sungbacteria bacterium]
MFFWKKRRRKLYELEVDEVFFDGHQLGQNDLKWSHRLEKPIPPSHIKRLGYFLFFVLILVLTKEVYLVLFKGGEYSAKAKANYIKEIWERAPRGVIYDSRSNPLVKNTLSFNLVMIPAELPRDRELQEKMVGIMADLLGRGASEIKNQFKEIDRFSFRPVLILEDLDHAEFLAFKSKLEELPGFRLEENFKRIYETAGVFSHVLGYTGRVTADRVKSNPNYLLTDLIGKSGLEAEYEEILRGRHGVTLVESYARGGIGRVMGSQNAEPGHNLTLFLDAELQEKITETTRRVLSSLGLNKAAVVALDPKSGGILALQSFPVFDGNVFASRLNPENYRKIFENRDQPLFNRVLAGLYPPGSTIKPFLGVAALQEKIIDDKTIINDTGSITVGSQEFRGWSVLGLVDIYRAIAMSSNIFFYTVGGGYGNISGLGPVKIGEYLKKFGFSDLTKIDLPGEASGFIPTPEWKRFAKKEAWFTGDTYNMSIGQGFIQVTPLELAAATGAIANNGFLIKPRVVKTITDKDGKIINSIEPEILSRSFVDADSLAIIRRAMGETVNSGSARSLANLPGGAGGKTGTAETGVGNNTHAWFTVFAPYEDPKIVLTVLVENGGEGSSVAVPIAREVLEWYLAR